MSLACSGCTVRGPNGSVRRHYFGYTVVTIPKIAPERPDFRASDVSNLGLSVGSGSLGLGYNRTKDIILPPDGALYIEVNTDAQFERAQELIETYKGICITQTRRKQQQTLAKP